MPIDDSRHPGEEMWRSQEGDTVSITNEEVCKHARKLERKNMAIYWASWGLLPPVVALYIRAVLRIHQPLLITGIGLGLATFLLIVVTIVRNRPARISTAQPCLDFVRARLRAKQR